MELEGIELKQGLLKIRPEEGELLSGGASLEVRNPADDDREVEGEARFRIDARARPRFGKLPLPAKPGAVGDVGVKLSGGVVTFDNDLKIKLL